MKFDYKANEVSVGGVDQRKTFGIALNKKTFDVIIRSQYKDIYLAVLRELYQNANDSHIRAGKQDIPVDIKLPNVLEPQLVISDYGVGMSREFVMTRYTTVFDSTKNDNNQEDGGYGWGRLVALAFSGNYTLISYYNGTKSTYSVFFNNDDIPDIVLIGAESTDRCNGVSVIVNIPVNMVHGFAAKLQPAFEFCQVPPNILSGESIYYYKNVETKINEDKFMLCRGSEIVVWSGVYGYSVDRAQIQLSPTIKQITKHYSIILKVPLGQIKPTAARDGLVYDNNSITTINEYLEYVEKQVISSFNQKITDDMPIVEYFKVLNEARNLVPLDKLSSYQGMTPNQLLFTDARINGRHVEIVGQYRLTITDNDKKRVIYKPNKNHNTRTIKPVECVAGFTKKYFVYNAIPKDPNTLLRIKHLLSDKPIDTEVAVLEQYDMAATTTHIDIEKLCDNVIDINSLPNTPIQLNPPAPRIKGEPRTRIYDKETIFTTNSKIYPHTSYYCCSHNSITLQDRYKNCVFVVCPVESLRIQGLKFSLQDDTLNFLSPDDQNRYVFVLCLKSNLHKVQFQHIALSEYMAKCENALKKLSFDRLYLAASPVNKTVGIQLTTGCKERDNIMLSNLLRDFQLDRQKLMASAPRKTSKIYPLLIKYPFLFDVTVDGDAKVFFDKLQPYLKP